MQDMWCLERLPKKSELSTLLEAAFVPRDKGLGGDRDRGSITSSSGGGSTSGAKMS